MLSIPADEVIQAVAVPALRLITGAAAALCLVIPFVSKGGLRRVLALRLPTPMSIVLLVTLANLDAFKVATDRTITAYYASGLFASGGMVRRIWCLPGILASVWRSVVLWLTEASDFKWEAHDVPGLIAAYSERVVWRYSGTRTIGVALTVMLSILVATLSH